jgi:hypothetical protein
MPIAIIRLTYRQIIDVSAQTDFEKNVLHFSYEEYKMKSQAYNSDGSITTFTALKEKDGRANSLHYKTGFAIDGLVDGLKNIIPYLQDTSGQRVAFETYKFELIESDIANKQSHKVAIHYITGRFILYQVIGEILLLSKSNDDSDFNNPAETFMIKIRDGLSIIQYQEFPILSKVDY